MVIPQTHVQIFLRCFITSQSINLHFNKGTLLFVFDTENVEAELLHTFTKVYKFDTMLLMVRLAVLTAVTLTVPIVLFPVSTSSHNVPHQVLTVPFTLV